MRHSVPRVVHSLLILLFAISASAAQLQRTADAVPGEVLVKIKAGTSQAVMADILAESDEGERLANVASGTLWLMKSHSKDTDALAASLAKNAAIEYAEPNYILRLVAAPNDTLYNQLWGLNNSGQTIDGSQGTAGSDIDAEAAWTITTGSSSIVVGVVDTGVDFNHPDLAANMWSNPGGKGNAACAAGTHGFNAITKTCNPMDDHYHGTHVAGTIGAVGNNGVGVTGVNWTASIMALKFLGSQGSGTTSNAIAAIEFAIQAKIDGVNVRVLSNSWGGGGFSKALLDVINKAHENDILFVAAAGNDGISNDVYAHYPSNYATPNMIAVAATENRDGLAWFSNYGATTVHLGAPGVSTLSTAPGSSYYSLSGTSMATPHVAGVAALLLSKTPSLTTSDVKSTILNSTDPIPSLAGKTVTGGRLNAAKVVGAPATPEFTLAVTPASRSVLRGSSTTYTVTITPLNGFTGAVTLSLSNLPTGVSGTFSPNPATTTSTLTVSTTNATQLTTFSLSISGVSGALTRTAFAGLTVVATAPAATCPMFGSQQNYSALTPTAVIADDFNRDGRSDIASTFLSANAISIRLGNGAGAMLGGTSYNVGTAPISIASGDFNSDGIPDLATANSGSNDVSILLGDGDGTFGTAVAFDAGASPFYVAAGDFNNDGNSDLAVANNASADVSILIGAGDGTFAAPVDYDAASGPFALAIGDFDRDGNADLAVADYNVGKVSILLGNGDGTFSAAVHYTVAAGSSSVAAGDFNSDGKPDLAVTNYSANNVSILSGNGDGTFQAAVHYPVGLGPYSVAVADFNTDGVSDLIVANGETTTVSILLGIGNGTFQAAITLNTGAYYPNHVSVSDFNGDAKPDFVLANTGSHTIGVVLNQSACSVQCGVLTAAASHGVSGNPHAVVSGEFNRDGRTDLAASSRGTSSVSLLLGNGDGTFAAALVNSVATNPDSIAAGDFNRDGSLDLATGNSGSGNVSVLLGNGNGSFQSAQHYSAGSAPRSIATADFNRDGKLDLAVATSATNNVAILLGNGDGTFQSPLSVSAGTAPFAATPGDFNRDGKTDLAVANSGSSNVSILLGNGDGTFQAATNFSAGTTPRAIVVDDFDRNGKADLVIVNAGSNNVSVLLGLGTGAFQAAVPYAVGQSPFHAAAGDINDDGIVDLAVANNAGGGVSVLLGTGSGTFGAASPNATGFTGLAAAAVTDIDRNGKADVALAGSSSLAVMVLRNSCPSPDLTVTKTHTDVFAQGSTGKKYVITAKNSGFAATSGPVSVTDVLPLGLFATAMSGSGWSCTLATVTCTRSDVLAGGASYPVIELTVSVSANAAANVINVAKVSGGGELNTVNNTASDPTAIAARTDLTVTSTHLGSFVQGATGKKYRLLVGNAGSLATSGTVTVTDTLPADLTATAISGSGWNCTLASLICNRSDVLAGGGTYPPITLTVNVAANAPPSVVNTATVAGGGQTAGPNDTSNDTTVIWAAQTCGSFGAPEFYATESNPVGLAKGMFNADSFADLATTNFYSASVSILLGKADGTFHDAVHYDVDSYPLFIAADDLDHDGKTDLVLTTELKVVVLRGLGNGAFAPALSHDAGLPPNDPVLGDFNQDGHVDVVVSNGQSDKISVFLGNGDGSLRAPVTYPAGDEPTQLVSADFDGNGTLDLATRLYGGTAILSGNGDGTFGTPAIVPTSSGTGGIVAADFNEDAKIDLAVARYFGELIILIGNGDGTFQTPVEYNATYGSTTIVAEDLNGDGKTDLLVGSTVYDTLTTYMGAGDGTFPSSSSLYIDSRPTDLVVGDFNADGKPDAASTSYYTNDVAILYGGCADLTITKTHSGNFFAGQQEAIYTLKVTNTGAGVSAGIVTVTDVLPSGLTPVYMYGSGWSCNVNTVSCTFNGSIQATESFPSITLAVNVAGNAPANLVNVATVSGGGDMNTANNTANDPTTIGQLPDLTISIAPTGMFAQGQTGRTYTITISNIGSAPTSGNVNVFDYLPSALVPTEMSGVGWQCNIIFTRSCSRSDALAAGSSYPPITLTVNVSNTAGASLTNEAMVSGGGDSNGGNNWIFVSTNVLGTPLNFVAAGSPAEVLLSWWPSNHASYYEIYRSDGGAYDFIGSTVGVTYTDLNVFANSSYIYRVRAVSVPTYSAFTTDIATTLVFTDDPIVPGVTTMKAVHVAELRTAINALRVAAGLPPAVFGSNPQPDSFVEAQHWAPMRTALDQARTALGLVAIAHTDPVLGLGVRIKAAHLRELRNGVR